MSRCKRLALFLMVGFLGLTGCRTYGEYDSEVKTYEAMQEAIQEFSEDLTEAEEALQLLEEAVSEADTLRPLAARFHDLVEEHRLLLEQQRGTLEEFSPEATHRSLSRTYRGMVKDQSLLRQHYKRTIQRVHRYVRNDPERQTVFREKSSYVIEPIGFPQSRQDDPMGMEEALRPVIGS